MWTSSRNSEARPNYTTACCAFTRHAHPANGNYIALRPHHTNRAKLQPDHCLDMRGYNKSLPDALQSWLTCHDHRLPEDSGRISQPTLPTQTQLTTNATTWLLLPHAPHLYMVTPTAPAFMAHQTTAEEDPIRVARIKP